MCAFFFVLERAMGFIPDIPRHRDWLTSQPLAWMCKVLHLPVWQLHFSWSLQGLNAYGYSAKPCRQHPISISTARTLLDQSVAVIKRLASRQLLVKT